MEENTEIICTISHRLVTIKSETATLDLASSCSSLALNKPCAAKAALEFASRKCERGSQMCHVLSVTDILLSQISKGIDVSAKRRAMRHMAFALTYVLTVSMTDEKFVGSSKVIAMVNSLIPKWKNLQYFPNSFFVGVQCQVEMGGHHGLYKAFDSI